MKTFRNRGYLCVSDMTKQLWCEQQALLHVTTDIDIESPELLRGTELHLARGVLI